MDFINHDLIGKISGFIVLLAFFPYIISIFKGKTKPNRATRLIRTIVSVIIVASYYQQGARSTLRLPLGNTVGMLVTFLISIRKGEGGWTSFDIKCLVGVLLGLLGWIIFKKPVLAYTASAFIDIMGFLPTIKKAYKDPQGESKTARSLWFPANTLNILAIDSASLIVMSYPIYTSILSGIIFFLLMFPRKRFFHLKKPGK